MQIYAEIFKFFATIPEKVHKKSRVTQSLRSPTTHDLLILPYYKRTFSLYLI